MRAFLIVALSCVAGVATAAPKQKVAILGLEVIASGLPDKDSVVAAQDLTIALRTRPKAGQGNWAYTPGSEKDLVDEKVVAKCDDEAPACMAVIGSKLGADLLIYGKLEKKSGVYQLSLRLLEVGTKKLGVGITDSLPVADATGTKLQDFARKLYLKLQGPSTPAPAPAPVTASKTTPPAPAKTSCDPAEPMAKGDDQLTMGNYGQALILYDKALSCDPNQQQALVKAFLAACRSNNKAKAKTYWQKMPTDKRDKLAQVCIKQAIDPREF